MSAFSARPDCSPYLGAFLDILSATPPSILTNAITQLTHTRPPTKTPHIQNHTSSAMENVKEFAEYATQRHTTGD